MNTMQRMGHWIFVVGVIFAILPIVSVFVASGLASLLGCMVNEAGYHSCPLFGFDIGSLLSTLYVSGWFFFITIPLGGGAAIVGLILEKLGSRKNSAPPAGA